MPPIVKQLYIDEPWLNFLARLLSFVQCLLVMVPQQQGVEAARVQVQVQVVQLIGLCSV